MKHIVFRWDKHDHYYDCYGVNTIPFPVRDVQIVGKFAYVFSLSRMLLGKYPRHLVNIVR